MRTLPDYLRKGMKMILVGSNPGDRSARVGHYYAGRNNQFWPILYECGVIPEPIGYEDDRRMLEFGIGMTDLVKRPTRAVDELERRAILSTLRQTGGDKQAAARMLGIGKTTLYRKLKQYQIERADA